MPTVAPTVAKPPSSSAYNGTPSVVPGNIAAINFDVGGPGAAYNGESPLTFTVERRWSHFEQCHTVYKTLQVVCC
jgi:hypothetical protein